MIYYIKDYIYAYLCECDMIYYMKDYIYAHLHTNQTYWLAYM